MMSKLLKTRYKKMRQNATTICVEILTDHAGTGFLITYSPEQEH